MQAKGYVGDLYADYEVRFTLTPKGRTSAQVRQDGGEWIKYPVRSATAMLAYGARLVQDEKSMSDREFLAPLIERAD